MAWVRLQPLTVKQFPGKECEVQTNSRFIGSKAALRKLLRRDRGGIQYVEHAERHGDEMFAAVCELGLEASSINGSMRPIGLAASGLGSKRGIHSPMRLNDLAARQIRHWHRHDAIFGGLNGS